MLSRNWWTSGLHGNTPVQMLTNAAGSHEGTSVHKLGQALQGMIESLTFCSNYFSITAPTCMGRDTGGPMQLRMCARVCVGAGRLNQENPLHQRG